MSGSGPRSFDATQALSTHYLYAVDVSRPYENWMVLARTSNETATIRATDIGLAPDREYLAWEFWTKAYLGAFQQTLTPGAVDPRFGVQAICLRERQAHPQLMGTNRHVSCGAFDVSAMTWSGTALEGTSQIVGNDPYELYLTEPAGFTLANVRVTGADVVANQKVGALRMIRVRAAKNATVTWHVDYTNEGK